VAIPQSRTAACDLAAQLAAAIGPRANAADRAGRLPPEDAAALKASGYLALSVPAAVGGGGLSLADCVWAHLVLAQASTSTALVAAMQLHLFGHARETRPWPDAIEARLYRLAVEGALLNSVASEPELGSPSRGGLPKTELTMEGDGYRLNGHKTWTTGGRALDHLLVRARLGDEAVVAWVPAVTPGVRWEETWHDALSLRASDSDDLFFDDVYVSADAVMASAGSRQPNAWFATLTAATYLGAAFAARDRLTLYAVERVPTALGRPIATLPNIQRQIGEMQAGLDAAQTLLVAAAEDWSAAGPEQREAVYPRIVAAKHVAVDTALRVTEQALRAAGGASLSADLDLERYFRDARAGLMHPPSGDAALELVGRAIIDGQQDGRTDGQVAGWTVRRREGY
jgi:alkylation response protein AidB-like acyl-CoA dehydrogenase